MKTFMFIGCSKSKCLRTRMHLTPEKMYQGDLFKKRVQLATLREVDWVALSAWYGLFWHDSKLPWYDHTFSDMCKMDVAAWAPGVVRQFVSSFDDDEDPKDIKVELHAGRRYYEQLEIYLKTAGFKVEVPCRGMGIGKQLAYYSKEIQACEPPRIFN